MDEEADISVMEALLAALLVAGVLALSSLAAPPSPPVASAAPQPPPEVVDASFLEQLTVTGLTACDQPGPTPVPSMAGAREWLTALWAAPDINVDPLCDADLRVRLAAEVAARLPAGSTFRLLLSNGFSSEVVTCTGHDGSTGFACPEPASAGLARTPVFLGWSAMEDPTKPDSYLRAPGEPLPPFPLGILCIQAPVPDATSLTTPPGSQSDGDGTPWVARWESATVVPADAPLGVWKLHRTAGCLDPDCVPGTPLPPLIPCVPFAGTFRVRVLPTGAAQTAEPPYELQLVVGT